MFQKAKNMDTAFRQVRQFSLFVLVACIGLSTYSIHLAAAAISGARQRIYILANGKILDAFAAERKDNIPVEAQDHVAMFHHYFFTLDPDEKSITDNISKALYLADASAQQQYENLKEKGYYAQLIAANINQEITVDSVSINADAYPYYFRCYAKERIVRSTSVVTRNLVTEGWLRNVSRSEHNSHGFLIEKWKTIQNQDLSVEKR